MVSPSGSVVSTEQAYEVPVSPPTVPDGAAGVNGGWLGVAIVTLSEGDHAETFPSESVALTFTAYVPACVQAWVAEVVVPEFLLPVEIGRAHV